MDRRKFLRGLGLGVAGAGAAVVVPHLPALPALPEEPVAWGRMSQGATRPDSVSFVQARWTKDKYLGIFNDANEIMSEMKWIEGEKHASRK